MLLALNVVIKLRFALIERDKEWGAEPGKEYYVLRILEVRE